MAFLLLVALPAHAGVTCHIAVETGDGAARIDTVDLDTGSRTTVVERATVDVFVVHGMVVEDGEAFVCENGTLVSIDLGDGATTSEPASCATVGGGDGVVLLDPRNGVSSVYADAASAAAGDASGTVTLHNTGAVALAPTWAAISARPSGAIHIRSRSTGAALRTLTPPTVRAPIWGLSLVGDALYVLDDARSGDERGDPAIRRIDPETGEELSSVSVSLERGHLARGLSCAAD